MRESLQAAFAALENILDELIGEPWTRVYWRTLMTTEPVHYFYYLPRWGKRLIYWTDMIYRTARTEDDLWVDMAAADEAAKRIWRTWIETNPGRSPWTSATWQFVRGRGVEEVYGYRHRHQVDPVEEQFEWETHMWGNVYIPYRIQRLRDAGYAAWRKPHVVRKRPHPWRKMPQGYIELFVDEPESYRGKGLLHIVAPPFGTMPAAETNEIDGHHEQ